MFIRLHNNIREIAKLREYVLKEKHEKSTTKSNIRRRKKNKHESTCLGVMVVFCFFFCILSLTSYSDFKSTKIIVYLRAYKRKLNIVAYLEGYIK